MSLAALIILAASAAPVDRGLLHAGEIKLFASTMAIAKTVKAECLGVGIDDRYLEALRLRLHVVEADQPVFAEEARASATMLHRGLAEAPSRQAWCDAIYRLYGPGGTLIRGLVHR